MGSSDPYRKIWGNYILTKLKKSNESEKLHIENMQKTIDILIDNRMLWGSPQKMRLSLLKENIASIAILERNLSLIITRIRTKINHINELFVYCVSSYHKFISPELSSEAMESIEKLEIKDFLES